MMGTNDIPIGMNIIELTTYVELLHNLIKYDQLLIFFMINFCFEITSNGLVTHFIVVLEKYLHHSISFRHNELRDISFFSFIQAFQSYFQLVVS